MQIPSAQEEEGRKALLLWGLSAVLEMPTSGNGVEGGEEKGKAGKKEDGIFHVESLFPRPFPTKEFVVGPRDGPVRSIIKDRHVGLDYTFLLGE